MKWKLFLLVMMLLPGSALWAQAQSAPDPSNQQPTAQDTKPAPDNSTPSLADVAAKDRAAAATKKAKHVYTNDEIPSRPDEPAAASQDKDAASADADKSADASGDKSGDKKKEEEDSVEVKGAKKVVEAKSIQIDAVTDEMHKLEYDLANAKTPDEASSIAQSIRNLQHNIEVWKNVRDDAQKVVDEAKKPKPQSDSQQPQQ